MCSETMKPEHQVLIDARKLIEKPETWTQGALYRNGDGKACYFSNPTDVVCYCMLGALSAASDDSGPSSPYARSYDVLTSFMEGMSVTEFNDTKGRKHIDVLRALDAAIEAML